MCDWAREVFRFDVLHNFTGVDWGGKFVGILKKMSLISLYSSLPNDGLIISAFQILNEGVLRCHELMDMLPYQFCAGNYSV